MDNDFITWRGHSIHVKDTGTGNPLLLLTGLGGHTEMWTPFVRQFAKRRIICFDAPGTGLSSTPMFPVPVAALAELAAVVLDARGVASADVVGFSYGGAIAQQFANDYPSRIERLVLAATNCGIGAIPGALEVMMALATPLRYYSPTYFERTAAAHYGGVTGRDAATRQRMAAFRIEHPPSAYGYAMQLLGAMWWSSCGYLEQIPHETLVISGDDDPLIPVANAEMLARRIPRATLEIVKDAGHLFLWDDAKHLATRIRRFVDGPQLVAVPRPA
jgi:poly(3-hydroxyalkanoate) depolymerase